MWNPPSLPRRGRERAPRSARPSRRGSSTCHVCSYSLPLRQRRSPPRGTCHGGTETRSPQWRLRVPRVCVVRDRMRHLEKQSRRELHLTRRRVASAGNRAERGASELAVRVLEIGDVGEVVDLVPDLYPCATAGRKLLEHRQIDSPLWRS